MADGEIVGRLHVAGAWIRAAEMVGVGGVAPTYGNFARGVGGVAPTYAS